MTESEGEIEYLDEDADVVQQYVQTVELPVRKINEKQIDYESVPSESKKRKTRNDDDSDYNPREEYMNVRKKTARPSIRPRIGNKSNSKDRSSKNSTRAFETDFRKKLSIAIPDYEDPLCLPVTALRNVDSDLNKIKKWNNMCLQQLKVADEMLQPDKGTTASSKRTVILKNVKNDSGNYDTTVFSKTTVENETGDTKSIVHQGILPHYRERTQLTFRLRDSGQVTFNRDIAILTKEDTKDGQYMVVYKPNDSLSAAYKLIEKQNCRKIMANDDLKMDEMKVKRCEEVTCCKVCAPCYQMSWRGASKKENKNIECCICNRTCISIYNLLSHVKTHSVKDVRKHKRTISKALASIVDYHYTCKICQSKFDSIVAIRRHVRTHRGKSSFICEIGNHLAH